jgi:deazaflavin-dependent oxidoreductase (nitroreductase family)
MRLLHRLIRWLGHRRWFAAAGRRFGAPLDRALYRLTRGKLTSTAGAAPVMLLTTTGRRSGRPRTTPVMYVRNGNGFVVSSENFGQQRPAAWPLNLIAEPHATIQVGGDVITCRARLLDDAEADVYWPRLVELWPAHESYRARSGQRHTFILEPLP